MKACLAETCSSLSAPCLQQDGDAGPAGPGLAVCAGLMLCGEHGKLLGMQAPGPSFWKANRLLLFS